MTDQAKAARLTAIAESLAAGGSDALVGVQSLIREIEATDPGSAERLRADLAQRQIARGLPAFARR